jgi:lipopolysaccharide/colanic/teichoic acid biosynthesis glycosyltransferase
MIFSYIYLIMLFYIVCCKILYTTHKVKFFKLCFDSLLVSCLFFVSIPIYILVSIILFSLEGNPILYKSKRLITKTKEINVYKFRTMILNASSEEYDLKGKFMKDGFLNIPLSHKVYTPLGRILEKYQLVELPQLINIIRNGMSIVGNRPLPKDNIEQFKNSNLDYEKRFYSPAGVTGISQIVNKHKLTAIQRLELETMYSEVYLRGKVLSLDIKILFYTISYVILSKELSYNYATSLLRSHMKK